MTEKTDIQCVDCGATYEGSGYRWMNKEKNEFLHLSCGMCSRCGKPFEGAYDYSYSPRSRTKCPGYCFKCFDEAWKSKLK